MGLLVDPRYIRARKGKMLVERIDPTLVSGTLILPKNAEKHSPSAIVRRVGAGVTGYQEGDQVLLVPSRGKELPIGQRDEMIWESVPPTFVKAILLEDGLKAERRPEHPFRDIPPDEQVIDLSKIKGEA